ncbi:MAG: YgfZ/GcvT domain-containing protein, partial [Acetobacteraceae bacterium]
FLQGLVSNDVAEARPGHAVWAALLTPQGKWLADFFIFAVADRLLLDAERAQIPMLLARLGRFRLRASVSLAAAEEWAVCTAWDGPPPALAPGTIAAPDPRLPEAGWRLLLPAPPPPDAWLADAGLADAGSDAWDRHRLALGLPDGARDLESEKTVLLEAGFDELSGISWTKGCYMGQELTARTRYRGLVKRRLVPVGIEGDPPAPGTPVLRQDATRPDGAAPIEVGSLRSLSGDLGLALLRLDALSTPLACGAARLIPRIPGWMRLPEAAP